MMKKVSLSVCLLGMCLVMSSWGFLGHKTVQQLAIYELPKSIRPFFYKNKDKLVAEYALSDIQKPIGVSEYQLTQSLPKNLQSKLPSIADIENELGGDL